MSTIPLGPARSYTDRSLDRDNIAPRPLLPAIRWGAVLAGVVVGVSMQLLLGLLGVAIGLSANSTARATDIGNGALLWAGFSLLVAAFVGSYVAARMTGFKRKVDGILHGIVSWAVITLLFATLATSVGNSFFGGVFRTTDIGMASNAAYSGAATTNIAAWAVFIAVSLSLVLGIIGGVFGALGARRTTWSDSNSAATNPS